MSTNMADWQYTIYAQDKALDGVDDLALLSAVEGRITEITDLAATRAVRVAGVRGPAACVRSWPTSTSRPRTCARRPRAGEGRMSPEPFPRTPDGDDV
ncbi:MAG: hypothetical protein QOF69_73 [Solirubrobacteraceae bacterium]|jgi:hypothetical protein|nr:hypothetical protein [Solirubrobacteraceae bacterium]